MRKRQQIKNTKKMRGGEKKGKEDKTKQQREKIGERERKG